MTPSKLSSTAFGGGSVAAKKVDIEGLERKAAADADAEKEAGKAEGEMARVNGH
jgi:hypothetical protein